MTAMKPDWLGWHETEVLAAAFEKQKAPLRFVGGAVRDALLKRHVKDVDAATPLPPEQTMALLAAAHIHAIPTGIDHGTVTAIIANHHFEITTLRRDVSTDGRHAQVAYTDDWKEDAARRDFTMNALYLSPQGELYDYFGGQEDAKAGQVRFIGDAAQRIAEDYLRILRFFRFHAHYGKHAPDNATLAACAKAAPKIATLSGGRIQQEMLKLLAAQDAYPVLAIMQQHRILERTLGFSPSDVERIARLEKIDTLRHIEPQSLVKLAGLIEDAALLPALIERLRLSNAQARVLQTITAHRHEVTAQLTQGRQKHWLRKLGTEDFEAIVALNWAQEKDISEDHPYAHMLALADEWVAPDFPVTGKDLIAAGISEGKELGELLKELEARWEESDYTLTREELLSSFLRKQESL